MNIRRALVDLGLLTFQDQCDLPSVSCLSSQQFPRESKPGLRPRAGILRDDFQVVPTLLLKRFAPAAPTPVFDTYWKFAAERQEIFFRKLAGSSPPFTSDPILARFKFTNAYRASDRVSQYLIREVIYRGDQSSQEVFFRTILFKLFNRIETWKLLERELGVVSWGEFELNKYDTVLNRAMAAGQRIYSAAYIMPSGGRGSEPRKHRNHLRLLQTMMEDEVSEKITQARCMRQAFELLRSFPMIGDFLGYQYVIDLNYSTLTDFSELEFVVPGPGARDGIRKCFSDLGGLNEADIIRMMADRQEEEFARLDIQFQTLWGRRLQLIDCQNLFCEFDKYARHAHPEIRGISGRNRIKQVYKWNPDRIDYWYPPKWGLNEPISKSKGVVDGGV
jgi:hypothetical protein